MLHELRRPPSIATHAGAAVAILSLAFILAGCTQQHAATPAPAAPVVEPPNAARLVSPAGQAIFLDVRPRDKFEAGHPAGAVWLNLAEWTEKSRSPRGGFSDADGWRRRIGTLGISPQDRVIIYDDGELVEAARVWYILQLFGVQNPAVLNGGYPALAAETSGAHITTGAPIPPQARPFIPATDDRPPVQTADKERVRSAVGGAAKKTEKPVVIWDARTEQEYAGTDARKNPRAGHIPGAINLSHKRLLDERGRLRSPAELRATLIAAGLTPDETIITHCQSGGRAALAALAARQAGYGDISNYYMSFGEWSADASCPLVAPTSQPGGDR